MSPTTHKLFLRGLVKRLRLLWVMLGLLLVVYLAAMNYALQTGAIQGAINRFPQRLTITWGQAWSPFPGWFRVKDLSIRGQGKKVQALVNVDKASIWLNPIALLSRRIHIPLVWGDGVEIRGRRRLMVGEDLPLSLDHHPPIAGLSNPPDPDPDNLYPVRPPVALEIGHLSVENLRQVWLDGVRFSGVADLSTEIRFLARSWIVAEGVDLDIHQGQLSLGGQVALRQLQVDSTLELEQVDFKDIDLERTLAALSAHVELQGTVASPHFLNHYLENLPWLSLDGDSGGVSATLDIDHGLLAAGSSLNISPGWIGANIERYLVSGPGIAQWVVTGGETPMSQISLKLKTYTAARAGAKQPMVEGKNFVVTATSPQRSIASALTDLSVVMDMPEAQIRDVPSLNAYLPAGTDMRFLGGRGTISASFDTSAALDEGTGQMTLAFSKLRVRAGEYDISGAANLAVNLGLADLKSGRIELGGTSLNLARVDLTSRGQAPSTETGWWANVNITRGTLEPAARVVLSVRGNAALRDSAPIVALFVSQRDLPNRLQDVLSQEDVASTFAFSMGDRYLRVEPLVVNGDDLSVSARFKKRGTKSDGYLLIKRRSLDFGVEIHSGKRRKIRVAGAEAWYQTKKLK